MTGPGLGLLTPVCPPNYSFKYTLKYTLTETNKSKVYCWVPTVVTVRRIEDRRGCIQLLLVLYHNKSVTALMSCIRLEPTHYSVADYLAIQVIEA